MSGWTLTQSSFALNHNRAYEGLFTLGSGYLHVRGSFEERLASARQDIEYMRQAGNVTAEKFVEMTERVGAYVPGVFAPHPLCNNEMVNLPFFLELAPSIAGEKLDLETSRHADFSRTLDLRRAVLSRQLTWQPRSGGAVKVHFERFISATRKHLCVQRLTFTADRAMTVDLAAGIDANVRTNGFDHFRTIEPQAQAASAGMVVLTDGQDRIEIQCRLRGPIQSARPGQRARYAGLQAVVPLAAGQPVTIEKRTAVVTSRDLQPVGADDLLDQADALSYAQLLAEHEAHWAQRWAKSDVVVEGDAQAQEALRASIFHLLRSHVPDDPRVAIDAKGYAGEAYWGRFFWDTEIYMMPFFLYTDPARARTLVDFRLHTLASARKLAEKYGYRGARFPWESDGEGNDCCPSWQYRDHEVHVTADVGYALAHYATAADAGYLAGPAAQAVVEIARYYADRVDFRSGENFPSILGVMGPNEYAPLTNNHAFTNRLAAFCLDLAARQGEAGGASAQERGHFATLAKTLPIPRTRDGLLVLENEDFLTKAEPDFNRFWPNRGKTFASQVSQERIYRSKVLKQADVLMLMMMFPQEFTDAQVQAAWDYYLPYTTHDSSLSAGAHAIIACRLNKLEAAWEFWRMSADKDLDVAHGGAAEGIHIAGCGANWQIMVFGFAGLRTALQSETFTLDPKLPPALSRLAFPIVWKGTPLQVEITRDLCRVENQGNAPLTVTVSGRSQTVAPGASRTFPAGRLER